MTMDSRNCPECGQIIRGRTDKKFCSNDCRSFHHNKIRGSYNQHVRAINCVLQRNRRILMECNEGAPNMKIPLYLLQSKGFDFSYFTHCMPDRRGRDIVYIYDYGYQKISGNSVKICIKK